MHRRILWLTLAGLLAASSGAYLVYAFQRVGVAQGYAPEQPIAFSHALHAGEYQIPCLYCHFGAEKSRHAGIPPSGVCMNCHTRLKVQTREIAKLKEAVAQDRALRWIKIHNLPDFVYFDHSRHVGAGVDCGECHGAVETMARVRQEAPLTMGWCLECHRTRGITELPRPMTAGEVPSEGRPSVGGQDCQKCHY